MKRRALLTLGAGAAAWVAAWVLAAQRPAPAAFTHGRESLSGQGLPGARLVDLNPDRMWPVYRRYHLLIVSQRDDEGAARDVVGIRRGVISGNMKVSFQAARSIG